MHFTRLANTLLEDEEIARDNHVLAYNFANYLPIFKKSLTDTAIKLYYFGYKQPHFTFNIQ